MLLTASKIHDGKQWLPEGTIIEVDDNGVIIALHDSADTEGVIRHEGIIVPGLVNTHCHLELSHMKGVIPEHAGLVGFLKQVLFKRNGFTDEQKASARQEAFDQMLNNGIVAVGDIANTTDTLDLRAEAKMHFHTFVEAIGFNETPQKQFDFSVAVYHGFDAQQHEEKILRQTIVPHAPYSVSQAMFSLVDKFDEIALLSVHNQECHAEDEYYLMKKGEINDLLQAIGIDDSFFTPSGKTSLQTYLQWLSPEHPVIFVHNTYTNRADIEVAQTLLKRVYWCLCPNANKYIENTLPDIPMLQEVCDNICIGTDSLSSNHELCILSELFTIKEQYHGTDWEDLLRWATYNGAVALQMDDTIGSIEPGKKPGLVLLDSLQQKPAVKVLL